MNKSDFKVGKKVYVKDSLGTEVYMYSLDSDDRYVLCTNDAHGHGAKLGYLYSALTNRKPKEQRDAEKNYKHSHDVVRVFNDVEDLYNLRKGNPTYNDTIVELMRPYISNARYWDFVLHTAADNPKLHEAIKEILIKSNSETNE